MATETPGDIFTNWLKKVLPEPPVRRETIWHYTNATGLLGILTSNRLWATDAVFLNDAVEFKYGTNLFISTLLDLNLNHTREATRAFIDGLLDPDRGALREWLRESVRLFVTCFCSSDDLLSQWRAYAGNDKFGGYAIGFTPPGAPPAWAQTASHPLTLRQVIYEEDAQRQVCRDLLEPLVAYLDSAPNDRESRDSFARELVNGIAEVATWCKHPAFAEEKEWRLSYYPLTDKDPLPVRHRVAGGLVVPYVELPVPRAVGNNPDSLPITAIQCGPSEDPERKARGVESLLKTIDTYGLVKVRASTMPARL